ncbi:MAG: STT3 domain-containing protein [archaeon]|nr:STT3 domain-containing protein [archaeon]
MNLRERLAEIRSIFYRPVVSRRSAIVFLSMAIVFVIALFMRIYPAMYGWYLNEFDPYFDYYASLHVVTLAQQHGLWYALFNQVSCPTVPTAQTLQSALNCQSQQGYFYWHSSQFWYPYGRNIAPTSQVGLQFTGAFTYLFINSVLRIPISYYNWLVFFPVLFGSLTTISLYYLVKRVTNSAGGILAALVFAVSPPILQRGNLGWFKSEPLALFLATIGSYFFLTVFNSKISMRSILLRGLLAGLLFGYAETAWGGGDEFILVFALIFLAAPFVKLVDMKRTAYGGSVVVAGFLLVSGLSPRPGISEISGLTGLGLIFAWIFTFFAYFLRTYGDPLLYLRNVIKVLLIEIFGGLLLLAFKGNVLSSVTGRYITVIDTFYRSGNPLVQSVAEQAIPTGANFFQYYAILIFLAAFGIYSAMKRKNMESLFALSLGITGVYIATSFSRLMVYSTLALALLAAIGTVAIAEAILRPSAATISRKKSRIYEARSEIKVAFVVFMIIVLTLPMFYPSTTSSAYNLNNSGYFASANVPVSIANGATTLSITSKDWFQAFQFIRQTPPNSTIVSWWDYGYWVAVMGNRTTLADNATSNGTQIALIGRVLVSSPKTSLQILEQDLHKPTYILIFIAGSYAVPSTSQTGGPSTPYFFLTVNTPYPNPPGGDESKKQWFIRIGNTACDVAPQCPAGGIEETNGSRALMYPDDFTPTPYFWANTTMGQLIPLQPTNQYEFGPALAGLTSSGPCGLSTQVSGYNGTTCSTNGASGISDGYTEFYTYQVKDPSSNSSAPFQLSFESSSILNAAKATSGNGVFQSVLIYKINYNAIV